MSENNPIRVFATHVFEETIDYLRVFEFLESADRFYYVNVSKPENVPDSVDPQSIKDELIAQIKLSEAMFVIPDLYDAQPEMANFMMDVADANKIGKIGLRPFGGMAEMPEPLAERCQESIEWNEREMIDALKRQARGEDTSRWEVLDFPGWDADGPTD